MSSKISVAEMLKPVEIFNRKKEAGEPVTQEEVDEVRALLPISMAYSELMRQIKKYNDARANTSENN